MTERTYVVRDNRDERRYELLRDGELVGQIEYLMEPNAIVLVHTEVAPSAEGEGVGGRLVSGALDDIRARELRLVPMCDFVASYLRRHPEHQDLVARENATSP